MRLNRQTPRFSVLYFILLTLGALGVMALGFAGTVLLARPGMAEEAASADGWPTLAPDAAVQAASPRPGVTAAAPTPTPTIPDPGATPTVQPVATHVVAPGDTLEGIAALYGVPLDSLEQYNGVTDADVIFPEMVLRIPPPDAVLPTPVLGPTATLSAAPTATAQPTLATENPLYLYTVDYLMQRGYDGGEIVKEALIARTEAYDEWSISYTTDENIRVTGLANIPHGEGPWPVIVLLHGGYDQSVYQPGDGTRNHADYFARNGYLTIAPDYRSYNNTEGSGSPLKIPWSVDALNLVEALDTLPEADAARVGLLGHSRGGGVASYPIVLSSRWPQIKAAVLYAPLSFDQAENWRRYVNYFGAEWPTFDAEKYGSPETNPEGYALVSPINYLDRVVIPVQIHHGTDDSVLPVEWSRELSARLDALGKTVDYYEYPEAGHTFYNEDYILFSRRALEFFDEYVKGTGQPAG